MSNEVSPLDLKYALFCVVAGVVRERAATAELVAEPESAPQGVTEHVRMQVRALDDAALRAVHVKLARGFLLELDARLSDHQAELASNLRR